jgi:pimeloyl-ACP methyl ester carboxylesterase
VLSNLRDQKTNSIPGSSGRNILIDLTYREADAPMVIFVHGFKGFKDWGSHNLLANYFADNGFRYLKFNFSHNGTTAANPLDFDDLEAFGENTFSKELFDLNAVIDYACSGDGFAAATKVCLIGHSRGGGISIIKAAEDDRVAKLVTWAAINRFDNLWDKTKEAEWRQNGVIYTENARTKQHMPLNLSLLQDYEENKEALDILGTAGRIWQPCLIAHGDADPAVPVTKVYELKEPNEAAELYIIPGANHVFGSSHPYMKSYLPPQLQTLADRTIDFLKSGD